jgi:tRNA-2-methylthio-N6-dimethylallyladenosine synthase
VVRQARFAAAFTFQYSKRPGTPAAELDGQVPKPVVQERYERLVELQERISLEGNRALLGQTVELLVAAGEGRKDIRTARMTGRAHDGRLVHFAADEDVRPGDIVTTAVTGAAPHHLIADAGVLTHRRTRAGDAHGAGRRPGGVGLGMPTVGPSVGPAEPTAPLGCAR